MNQINKAVDRQPPVNATEVQEVQKDVRSNPGDEIENEFKTDGTRMAQDGKIMPKPGLRKINWWQNTGQISDTWK